jgi:hypothetical protein
MKSEAGICTGSSKLVDFTASLLDLAWPRSIKTLPRPCPVPPIRSTAKISVARRQAPRSRKGRPEDSSGRIYLTDATTPRQLPLPHTVPGFEDRSIKPIGKCNGIKGINREASGTPSGRSCWSSPGHPCFTIGGGDEDGLSPPTACILFFGTVLQGKLAIRLRMRYFAAEVHHRDLNSGRPRRRVFSLMRNRVRVAFLFSIRVEYEVPSSRLPSSDDGTRGRGSRRPEEFKRLHS